LLKLDKAHLKNVSICNEDLSSNVVGLVFPWGTLQVVCLFVVQQFLYLLPLFCVSFK